MAFAAGEIEIIIKARDDASRVLGRVSGAANKMGGAIRAASKVGAVGLVALGVAAVKFGSDFQNAEKIIRRGTGATGEALEALKADFKETFRGVPDSMNEVATATADINTRLGLTGEPLQQMTRQFLDFARVTETDVATAVAAGTRVFGDWSIATDLQSEALDHVFRVSQTTGIGVDSLMQKVVQFGAPLRQFGFGFEEATVLLGKWEKEGVNTEAILGALKIGVANFARENVDAATGLQNFLEDMTALGPGAEATGLAIEIFGSRAGPDMAAAVAEGRFELDALMATVAGSEETIAAAAKATLTWQDKLKILRNEVLVKLEPVLTKVVEKLEDFGDWLSKEGLPKTEEFIRSLRPLLPVLASLWESFTTGIQTIRPPLEALVAFIVDNKPILVAAITAIGVAIVLAFGPAALAVVAIVGLITLIGFLRDHWEEIKNAIVGTVEDLKNKIVGVFTAIVDWVKNHWIQLLLGALGLFMPWLWVALAIFTFRDEIRAVLDKVIDFFTELPGDILDALGDLAGLLFGAGVAILQGLLDGLKSKWAEVSGFVGSLPGKILSLKGPDDPTLLLESGRQIMGGLLVGLQEGFHDVEDFLQDAGSQLASLFSGVGGTVSGLVGEPSVESALEAVRLAELRLDAAKLEQQVLLEQAQVMNALTILEEHLASIREGAARQIERMTAEIEAQQDVVAATRDAAREAIAEIKDNLRTVQAETRATIKAAEVAAREARRRAESVISDLQRELSRLEADIAAALPEDQARSIRDIMAELDRVGPLRRAGIQRELELAKQANLARQTQIKAEITAQEAAIAAAEALAAAEIAAAEERLAAVEETAARLIAQWELVVSFVERQLQSLQDEMEAYKDAIAEQEEAIRDMIETLEDYVSPAERALAALNREIEGLEFLAEMRRLERELLAAQILTTNELLKTDAEVLDAIREQEAAYAQLASAMVILNDGIINTLDAAVLFQLGLFDLGNTILNLIATIGNVPGNIPIPTFHAGGIAPGPVGAPLLARVTGGEAILTPEDFHALIAGLKGGGRPVVVNVYPRTIEIHGDVRQGLADLGAGWALRAVE